MQRLSMDHRVKPGGDGEGNAVIHVLTPPHRHPEVLGVKRRASKDDGPSASAEHPSRLAALTPQDDGIE
jgi:hypothetical protein